MIKHAYLIMAHGQFDLLERLIKSLDDGGVDFYLHIDKKSEFDEKSFSNRFSGNNIFFVTRVNVRWGSFTQIEAEMILLEQSCKKHYDFYHLITGVDTPLRSPKEINNFFEQHCNLNFIAIEDCWALKRVKYYYFFVGLFKRDSLIGRGLEKISLLIQKILRVNRLKLDKYAIGSAYFDIKDDFAQYLVLRKEEIFKQFQYTFCADEIFIHTLYLEYRKENPDTKRFIYDQSKDERLHSQSYDVMRAIDWKRGKPYVFDENDFEMLSDSGLLFCRKIDSVKSKELLKRIDESINQ